MPADASNGKHTPTSGNSVPTVTRWRLLPIDVPALPLLSAADVVTDARPQ